MQEWKTYRIGDICKRVCSGGTPKSTEPSYYDGEIPWLNTKEINFNRISSTEKHITQSGLDNSSAKWIDKNSVIVAMYGATAAKVAINTIPLTTNQACCNLSIDETKADYRFVYYWLCSHYTELASLANGGAQQNLNAQQIKDFEIKLPEIEIQQKIADLLWSIDNKIICNKSINDNLEQQAQALYKSWFVDFEPFKDQEFVESEFGLIPEGWHCTTISELLSIKYGKDHKKLAEGIVPVYGSGGLMRYVDTKLHEGEAVLIPRKGSLNNVMYVNEAFWTVDTMFYSIPKQEYSCIYAYLFLANKDLASMNAGSAVPSMTTNILNSMHIIAPPVEVLKRFNNICDVYFSRINQNNIENANLSKQRDTLLPKLMSGELKINEIDC